MFARHDLVWPDRAGWDGAHGPQDSQAALALWREHGWPCVARRQDAGEGVACLGIPLPPAPDGSKPRLAIQIPAGGVARSAPALLLADAQRAAPPRWQASLTSLTAQLPGLRVFGSLAMQELTGQDYVRPGSDIDILFAPASAGELLAGLGILRQHAGALPLDGEIVFPCGAAVAWKEWGSNARVLVKDAKGARLADAAALLGTLPP